jgi:glucose-1-phosphate thymidylyltransferase
VKAIIPAAGIGTRLRPHTYTLPKALLYVAGKPIIAHILDDVVPLAPSSIVLIVGYKGELIEQFVRKQYPQLTVDFVYQEERRGIGHAVDLTRKVADTGEPLLIVLGDTIIKTDLKKVAQKHVLGSVEDEISAAEVAGGRITGHRKPADPASTWPWWGSTTCSTARAVCAIRRPSTATSPPTTSTRSPTPSNS